MKHRDTGFWIRYAEDAVSREERDEAETHLYSCDQCLLLYIRAVEASGTIEPLSEESALELTERVMSDPVIRKLPHLPGRSATRSERKRTVIHYAIAVCLTLLLMSVGVFQELFEHTGKLRGGDGGLIGERGGSYTERIMERTDGWFDALKENDLSDNEQMRGR